MREIRPKYLTSSSPTPGHKRAVAQPPDLGHYAQGIKRLLANGDQAGLQRVLTHYLEGGTRTSDPQLALPAPVHKNRQGHVLIRELSQAGPALITRLLAAHHALTRYFPEKDQPKAAGSLRSIVTRAIVEIARRGHESAALIELTEQLRIKSLSPSLHQPCELAGEILIYEADTFRQATWAYLLDLPGSEFRRLPPAHELPSAVQMILETSLVRSLGRPDSLAEFTDLLYRHPGAVEDLSEAMLKALVGCWREFHLAEEPLKMIDRFGSHPWTSFTPASQRAILLDVMRVYGWLRQIRGSQTKRQLTGWAAELSSLSPVLDRQPWLRPLLHGYLLVRFYEVDRRSGRADKLAKMDQPDLVLSGLIMKICNGSVKDTEGLLTFFEQQEPELLQKMHAQVRAGQLPQLLLYLQELVANAVALATRPSQLQRFVLVRPFCSPKVLSAAVKLTKR